MIRSKKPLVAAIAATLVLTPTLTPLSADAASAPTGPTADLARKATDVLPVGDGLTAAFDSRASLPALTPTTAQRSALARIAGASVTWNASGTPRSIARPGGRVTVDVRKGDTVTKRVALRPNLLSQSSGAKVVKVTSQAAALPATNLVDDTEATAWQTGASDKAYNQGPSRSVTLRPKKRSLIDTVAVSVIKPIGLPRFAAAKRVLVQTSLDGKTWKTAKVAKFRFTAPRPAVPDLALRTYRLPKAVPAEYVRVVADAVFGNGATNASTALVAEVQAFGTASGIRPQQPPADKPVTSHGSVATGNAAQGSLLGLDPYRPGVTELSWAASCPDLPSANGADAWMTKLPKGAGDGLHAATYSGSVPIGEFLVFAYDEDCQPMTGGFALLDEATPIPAGAAYLGFLLLYGGGADFDVTITEPR